MVYSERIECGFENTKYEVGMNRVPRGDSFLSVCLPLASVGAAKNVLIESPFVPLASSQGNGITGDKLLRPRTPEETRGYALARATTLCPAAAVMISL